MLLGPAVLVLLVLEAFMALEAPALAARASAATVAASSVREGFRSRRWIAPLLLLLLLLPVPFGLIVVVLVPTIITIPLLLIADTGCCEAAAVVGSPPGGW